MSHELSSLITVLLQASGAEVVEWDAAEVETAIDWAIFFEKRYADRAGSAADKADAASTDASLRRLASDARLAVPLSAARLSRATELLLLAVMRGAHLSTHPHAAWLVEALLTACMRASSATSATAAPRGAAERRGRKRRSPAAVRSVGGEGTEVGADDYGSGAKRARLSDERGDGPMPALADAVASHVALGAALERAQRCGAALGAAAPLDVVRGKAVAALLNRELAPLACAAAGATLGDGAGAASPAPRASVAAAATAVALQRALDETRRQCVEDRTGRCVSVACWQVLDLFENEDVGEGSGAAGAGAGAAAAAPAGGGDGRRAAAGRRHLRTQLDALLVEILRDGDGGECGGVRLVHPSLLAQLTLRSDAIASAYTTRLVAESVAMVRRGSESSGGEGGGAAPLFTDARDWRSNAEGAVEGLVARLVDVARRSEALRDRVLAAVASAVGEEVRRASSGASSDGSGSGSVSAAASRAVELRGRLDRVLRRDTPQGDLSSEKWKWRK